jgi:uroporphyrinogen decarboxylase
MNSRERVCCAIHGTAPDRIPLTHATLPGAIARYGLALVDLYRRYPSDVADVGAATSGEYGTQIGVPSRDTWGSLWVRYTDEHKGQVVSHPLADLDDLPDYVPPDTASDAILREVKANLATHDKQRYTLADGDTLWQRMFYLHGYQATLGDLLIQPERCAALRDMILEVMVHRVERLCQLPQLDGIHFRDDWGTQRTLMIEPDLWRSFFKSAYARLFALVQDAGKHVWFHSDGVIEPILPDLIEIGVQVLNPQVSLIGRERLVDLCGGRACIQADIDRQWVLPCGSIKDVREAVRADIEAFRGWEGGYIGRGEIASDVPLKNAEAMLYEITHYVRRPAKRLVPIGV